MLIVQRTTELCICGFEHMHKEENPKTVAHFFFSLYNVLCKLIFKHPVIHGFLVLLWLPCRYLILCQLATNKNHFVMIRSIKGKTRTLFFIVQWIYQIKETIFWWSSCFILKNSVTPHSPFLEIIETQTPCPGSCDGVPW